MAYETKHTDTPTFKSKNSTTNTSLQHHSLGFLLCQDGSYLEQENTGLIVLDGSSDWSYQTKH